MNDATSESSFHSDFQRAKAILKTERRVTASLLQRRLGIRYISALHLAAELNQAPHGSVVRPDVCVILNSKTLHLLLTISDGLRSDRDIEIAEDELQALLTADGTSTTVTIMSATGESGGPDRARLAANKAVDTTEEIAHAFHWAKRLVVRVDAAPLTLMGCEIKIILSELRRRLDESCSISLGIHYVAPSEDDSLCVTVIFSC